MPCVRHHTLQPDVFYRAVNAPDSSARLVSIQRVMPEHEVPELFSMLKKAYEDRLNGASGALTDMIVDANYVDDDMGGVRCILSLKKK